MNGVRLRCVFFWRRKDVFGIHALWQSEQSSRGKRSGRLSDVVGEEQNIMPSSLVENRLLFLERISKSSEWIFLTEDSVSAELFIGVLGIGVLAWSMVIESITKPMRMLGGDECMSVEMRGANLKLSIEQGDAMGRRPSLDDISLPSAAMPLRKESGFIFFYCTVTA